MDVKKHFHYEVMYLLCVLFYNVLPLIGYPWYTLQSGGGGGGGTLFFLDTKASIQHLLFIPNKISGI